MGKTYRFNSKKRVQGRNVKQKAFHGYEYEKQSINYEGYDWLKGTIDPDWAINRMKTRIACVVDNLVASGVILDSERDDYVQKYNLQIVKFAEKYDPDHIGKSGRKSSPLHYLRVIESIVTSALCKYAKSKRTCVEFYNPELDYDDDDEDQSSSSVIERTMSDGCRSARNLWFKMDLATFLEMLSPVERRVLNMRLKEKTQEKIAEAISRMTGKVRDRDHVRKVIMVHIQKKARACGFCPLCEMEKRKNLPIVTITTLKVY